MSKRLLGLINSYETSIAKDIIRRYRYKPKHRYVLKLAVNIWCVEREHAISIYGPISLWDTSNVTDMTRLFFEMSQFDDDISDWDTSNVIYMTEMFSHCYDFNQPLHNWDVSSVINMYHMFACCFKFDQNLNNWDVSNVLTAEAMFYRCKSLSHSVFSWNMKESINISHMFCGCFKLKDTYKHIENWNFNIFNCEHSFDYSGISEGELNDYEFMCKKYMNVLHKRCSLCKKVIEKEILMRHEQLPRIKLPPISSFMSSFFEDDIPHNANANRQIMINVMDSN